MAETRKRIQNDMKLFFIAETKKFLHVTQAYNLTIILHIENNFNANDMSSQQDKMFSMTSIQNMPSKKEKKIRPGNKAISNLSVGITHLTQSEDMTSNQIITIYVLLTCLLPFSWDYVKCTLDFYNEITENSF